jgi:hypothetical protein
MFDFDRGIDVIVRFHDYSKLRELEKAIFSLIAQNYRPLNIHVCLQRFSVEDIVKLKERLAPFFAIENSPHLEVHNFEYEHPLDARSSLVNLGIAHARSRFLAFLDYDDILYPEAYDFLINRLISSNVGIAFGGIQLAMIDKYSEFDFVKEKSQPFIGLNLLDFMAENFCPIHSFVVDRTKVIDGLLFFDTNMNRNEDYDFLLRVTAEVVSDFSLVKTFMGEYFLKSDGSNTILTISATSSQSVIEWKRAENFIEARRNITRVSPAVQRSLGISSPVEGLTIRGLLDAKSLLLKPN